MPDAWRTRRYARVLHESLVILRVNRTHRKTVRLTKKNITGKLLDISAGGCGVEIAFFIPKGTRMNVFLDRSILIPRLEDAKGEVSVPAAQGRSRIVAAVASSVTRGVKKYRLGLNFCQVSKVDRELLATLVKIHERRKDPRIEL